MIYLLPTHVIYNLYNILNIFIEYNISKILRIILKIPFLKYDFINIVQNNNSSHISLFTHNLVFIPQFQIYNILFYATLSYHIVYQEPLDDKKVEYQALE